MQKRSRHARLQPGRLWLHHLHRQFRAAARGDRQGHPRARPRGRRGAVRQPQFRGPRQSDVRANYLASPPLVVAYALAGSITIDLATEPLGTGEDGEPVYLKDIWPSAKEIAKVVRKAVKRTMFRSATATCSRATRNGARSRSRAASPMTGIGLDLCAEPALFRRHVDHAVAGDGHRRRAHPRPVPRLHHHRPHLAGRLDQARQPGRPLSDRAWRRRRTTSTPTARGAAITR